MHDDAGCVDHGPQARRAGRQCGDGGVGDLLGFDLTGAGALLCLSDNGFHEPAPEDALGFGEPGVGEQHVGAGHAASGIGHVRPQAWRRRTGIEPASDRNCRAAILKTVPVTRPDTPPWPIAPSWQGSMEGMAYRNAQPVTGHSPSSDVVSMMRPSATQAAP